jgi:gliding motility-associated-like protein
MKLIFAKSRFKIALAFLFFFQTYLSNACDGMSLNVVSNVYMGNGVYQVTIQYCENVSNGVGSYVSGVIVQGTGGNITGTTTPSFTSTTTGTTITYNSVNANTVQWGEWDNNPAVPVFMNNGDPNECFTLVIQTDAPLTSVTVSGSSGDSNLGAGFELWNGRWCCLLTQNVPPVGCEAIWTAPAVCQNSTNLVDLNTTTNQTGVFSGTGVNSATGIFNPAGVTLPVSVTFTVGDAQFNCSSTQEIEAINLVPQTMTDVTLCQGESTPLNAEILPQPCEYTVLILDSGNDGWTNNAFMNIFINGVQFGGNHTVASNQTSITLPVSDGDVITFTYTEGDGFLGIGNNNDQNTIRLFNAQGVQLFNQNDPNSGSLGGGITVNCNNPTYTYSWSPGAGLSNTSIPNPIATPSTTTTYTVTVSIPALGCSATEDVTVTVTTNGTLPTFDPIATLCLNETVPALPTTSTNGITGTWSPSTISSAAVGTTSYNFTATVGQCASNTSISVTVVGPTLPTFNPISPVCVGAIAPTLPSVSTNGIAGTWSPAVSTSTAGTFTYIFTPNDLSCTQTTQLEITVVDQPTANLSANVLEGNSVLTVTFTNNSSNASNYTWNFGNGTILPETTTSSQTQSYVETGIYTIVLIASNGICSDADTIQIEVLPFPDPIIHIPNVYTPNGDGANDAWWIDVQNVKSSYVEIINRWGNLMVVLDELNEKWDGVDASEGVYFFKYVIVDLNDKEYTGHGHITRVQE